MSIAAADRKQHFIDTFMASFMAGYAVSIYSDACSRGQHERLRKLPAEDALHMAIHAWDHAADACAYSWKDAGIEPFRSTP